MINVIWLSNTYLCKMYVRYYVCRRPYHRAPILQYWNSGFCHGIKRPGLWGNLSSGQLAGAYWEGHILTEAWAHRLEYLWTLAEISLDWGLGTLARPHRRDICGLQSGSAGPLVPEGHMWTEVWAYSARTGKDICGLRPGNTGPLVPEEHLWTEAWARWTARTGKDICGRGPRKRWSDRTVGTSVDWGLVTLLVHSYREGHLWTED